MKKVVIFYKMRQIVICVCLFLSSLLANAADFVVDGFAYNVVSLDDMTCEILAAESTEYSGTVNLPSIVLHNDRTFSVVGVGKKAFSSCQQIEQIVLPETIKTIGDEAFSGCSSLLSVNIPASVTTIGAYAFEACSSLENISLPSHIKVLYDGVFYNCSSLKDIVIPEEVEKITNKTFYGCKSIETIILPKSCNEISSNSFNYCSNLKKVTIMSPNIGINGYYKPGVSYPFRSCPNLKEVYLSRYLAIVFFDYTILENITFFEGTNWTDNNDFDDTKNLKQFTILEKDIPTKSFTFSNSQYMNVSLIVPKESIEQYKETKPWSNFWNITAYSETTGIDETTVINKPDIIKKIENGKIVIKSNHGNYSIDGTKLCE